MPKLNFVLTKQAEQDIQDIWRYIARDNIIAAEKVADDFEDAFVKLAQTPHIGVKRKDLIKENHLRLWLVHNYYIIYNPEETQLQILRIISCYRNVENVMDKNN